jgi:hypothetical protein
MTVLAEEAGGYAGEDRYTAAGPTPSAIGRRRVVGADRRCRGVLYITTGDNYSYPATATSDASWRSI